MSVSEFLTEATLEGELIDEGQFTLSGHRSLAKLGEFALPFEAAWVLKVLQAIVASGVQSAVEVKLKRDASQVWFDPDSSWTISRLEEAFFDLGDSEVRSLNHLKQALWALGLGGRRAIRVALPGSDECLVWNGVRLRRSTLEADVKRGLIEASPLGVGAVKSTWIGRQLLTSERNADISKALTEYATTFPLPLTLDGRRIDGLELDSRRGWAKTRIPFCVVAGEADLPPFPIPPGTRERTGQMSKIDLEREKSLAILVTAFLKRELLMTYGPKEVKSQLVWVQDGIVLRREDLSFPLSVSAVTIFISADGLKTDLTGMQLLDSEERTRRAIEATRAAQDRMMEMIPFQTRMIEVKQTSKREGLAYSLFAMGSTMLLTHPFVAVFWVGLGLKTLMGSEEEKRDFGNYLAGCFDELVESLHEVEGSV